MSIEDELYNHGFEAGQLEAQDQLEKLQARVGELLEERDALNAELGKLRRDLKLCTIKVARAVGAHKTLKVEGYDDPFDHRIAPQVIEQIMVQVVTDVRTLQQAYQKLKLIKGRKPRLKVVR